MFAIPRDRSRHRKLSTALSVAARLAATTLTTTTAALVTCTALAAIAPANAAASTISWTGAGTTSAWSATANWSSTGTVPTTNASIAEADFFELGSACAAKPPATACYTTDNDVSGLKIDSMYIDYSRPYMIAGNPISLGADGLEADPDSDRPADNPARINAPISLSASQSWYLRANSSPETLIVDQTTEPTGDNYSLNLNMASLARLEITDAMELGPITVKGGELALGDGNTRAEINDQTVSPLTLTGSSTSFSVLSPGSLSGPISSTGADIFIGTGGGSPGTLDAYGNVTLDANTTITVGIAQPGTTPGVDAGQLTTESRFYPAGATLNVDLVPVNGVCHDLHVGDVYTLINAKGGFSGPGFNGLSDGSSVPIANACNSGTSATGTLHFTANTMTITVTAPGDAGDGPQPTVLPKISGATTVGSTLSVSSGTWSGLPSTFTYAWFRCTSASSCTPVATTQTYTLTHADLGAFFYAAVTATNSVSYVNETVGPTAAVTSAPSPPAVNTAAIRAALARALTVAGKQSHRPALLRAGGYRTNFTATNAGRLSITWTVIERIKHKRVKVTVATITKTITAAGKTALTIKLTASGRKLLRTAHGKLTLTATGTFAVTGTSVAVSAGRTIRLTS